MKTRKSAMHQEGVGLIEVLVALLVLSIGFLVSANMQLRGMRSNQESYYQSQALMLANEIMDRMRNNRAGVAAGKYKNMTTIGDFSEPDCASSGCDAAGLAELDRFEWSANLRNLRDESGFIPVLPPKADGTPASGAISGPAASGAYTITMSWARQDGESETVEPLVLKFIP